MEKLHDDEPVNQNSEGTLSDTDEEKLKQQLRGLRLGTTSSDDSSNDSSRIKQDDRPQPVESYNPKASARFINSIPYYAQLPQLNNNESTGSSFDSNEPESNNEKKPQTKPSAVPWRVASRSESPAKQPNGNERMNGDVAHLIKSYEPNKTNGTVPNGLHRTENIQKRSTNGPPVPVRPPHLAKKPKERGFVQAIRSYVPGSTPTTTHPANTHVQNGPIPFPLDEVPLRESAKLKQAQNKLEELVPQDEIDKRQSRILEKLMEEHHRLKEEAEKEAERQKTEYEEQEKKSREADAQIRFIAQKAREQHRNNLRTSSVLLPVLNNTSSTSFRDAV
jgi:hypothetical protein